jgi:hypothetical protein
MRVIVAAPILAVVICMVRQSWVMKILRLQLDRLAVRRAVSRVIPGMLIARERRRVGHAFLGHQPLQRVEPMPIVGLAGVGIARRLRPLDLVGKRRGPLRPGEQPALIQRERHREGLRLPRLAEHRPLGIAWNARDGGARGGSGVHHAGSRYGSNASIEIFTVGSASAPHNSAESNATV